MILESILAFVGLLVGVLLGKLTPEEFKSGKKYFMLLSKIFLFIIILILIYLLGFSYWLVGILFGLIVAYFFRNIYFYLGLAVFSGGNIFASFFVFLFGLPYGTLVYNIKKYNNKILVDALFFFVSAIVLLVPQYTEFIISFSAGALFIFFIQKT